MKSAVAAAAIAATYATSTSGAVQVAEEQWPEVFNELQQCLSPMGFCMSLVQREPDDYDVGVELGYKSKAECLAQSFHSWITSVETVAALEDLVVAADGAAGESDLDLFLLRRTAKLPVTGGLSEALETSITGGKYQGYLRCGGREYVYMYGEKKSVYNAVGNSFEKVSTPFGSHALTGFDLAFPVPTALRLSPYVLVQLEDIGRRICSIELDKNSDDVEPGMEHVKNVRGICPDKINLKLVLANGSVENIDATRRLAADIHTSVHAHGRTLLSDQENQEALNTFRVHVTSPSHVRLTDIPRSHLRSLMQLSSKISANVVWAEVADQIELSNYDTALITQAYKTRAVGDQSFDESISTTPFWASGITGKGQVVGVGDSGLATEHCFFKDPNVDTTVAKSPETDYGFEGHRKLVNYFAYVDGLTDSDYPVPEGARVFADHGTHVSGTVLGSAFDGSGASDNTAGHHGMAPDAKLSFFDIGDAQSLALPDDAYNGYLAVMYNHGARIQTNSWGVPFGNYYSDYAKLMDQFSFDHQDFVVLFAAGNSGYHKGSSGSLGSPGTQKNAVTVAASMNSDANFDDVTKLVEPRLFQCGNWSASEPCETGLAYFSSSGPTYDGRIKPDIAAPGFFVLSSDSRTECATTFMAGTSMACPAAAGNFALIRQYLEDGFYPTGKANADDAFSPMGALVKAIAINSAQPMTGDYDRNGPGNQLSYTQSPNFEYGFGRLQLDQALPLDGHSRENQAVYLDGDFANMPKVDNWQFNTYKFSAKVKTAVKVTLVWHDPSSMSAARTALVNDLDLEVVDSSGRLYYPNNRDFADKLNNVEQTVFEVDGDFTVRVKGTVVPFGPQPYALVVSGDNVALVKKTTDGKISFSEVEGEVSLAYYLAWLFGGISIGGAAFFGASKFTNKKRNEASESEESVGHSSQDDPFASFMVKNDEQNL